MTLLATPQEVGAEQYAGDAQEAWETTADRASWRGFVRLPLDAVQPHQLAGAAPVGLGGHNHLVDSRRGDVAAPDGQVVADGAVVVFDGPDRRLHFSGDRVARVAQHLRIAVSHQIPDFLDLCAGQGRGIIAVVGAQRHFVELVAAAANVDSVEEVYTPHRERVLCRAADVIDGQHDLTGYHARVGHFHSIDSAGDSRVLRVRHLHIVHVDTDGECGRRHAAQHNQAGCRQG